MRKHPRKLQVSNQQQKPKSIRATGKIAEDLESFKAFFHYPDDLTIRHFRFQNKKGCVLFLNH
ncbi:hypothetical protein [Alkalicoccobacillus plakortidis]|uniref:Uncharacterized protein n=1 Tax=Alkalicoccobacillus plakortidis TaxID=444060 RepID=A0ABT0XN61_9BACI|nr:hypothetical protein [Alkalicoccobacillus plakortidis]MCM2677160.1 hypothetical protein [Alkalicoccobacillus plakortidis]